MTNAADNPLDAEIAAYTRLQAKLEAEHMGEWVVFHQGEPAGFFRSFEEADIGSAERFGAAPCLIRKIGAGPRILPSSLWPPIHVT